MNIPSINLFNVNSNINCDKPKSDNRFHGFNNLKPLTQDTVSFSGKPHISFHLKDAIKRGDSYDILENLGFDVAVIHNNVDKLTVLEYGKPSEEYTFEDYGIDEEKLFYDIKIFEGQTNLKDSKIRKLQDQEFDLLNIADESIKEFDLGNAKIETLLINPQQASKLKFKKAQIENLYIMETPEVAKGLGKLIDQVEDDIYYLPDNNTVLKTKKI